MGRDTGRGFVEVKNNVADDLSATQTRLNARWRRSGKTHNGFVGRKRGQLVAFTFNGRGYRGKRSGNMAWNASGNIARTEPDMLPSLRRRRSVHQRSIPDATVSFCELCCFGNRIIEIPETIDRPLAFAS